MRSTSTHRRRSQPGRLRAPTRLGEGCGAYVGAGNVPSLLCEPHCFWPSAASGVERSPASQTARLGDDVRVRRLATLTQGVFADALPVLFPVTTVQRPIFVRAQNVVSFIAPGRTETNTLPFINVKTIACP